MNKTRKMKASSVYVRGWMAAWFWHRVKKRLFSEGHQAALGANLSHGLPRHIVEQEEALTEAPQTQAELHTGLKGAWHGVLCHRGTLHRAAKEKN